MVWAAPWKGGVKPILARQVARLPQGSRPVVQVKRDGAPARPVIRTQV